MVRMKLSFDDITIADIKTCNEKELDDCFKTMKHKLRGLR